MATRKLFFLTASNGRAPSSRLTVTYARLDWIVLCSQIHTSGVLSDHYETLGIKRNATKEEIKAAYIKLGKELHPDKHHTTDNRKSQVSHKRFVSVNEAYSILSKPESKRDYDLELAAKEGYGSAHSNGGSVPYHHQRRPTFEERARAAGFKPTNYAYYDDMRPYWTVAGCIVFIIAGFIFHFYIASVTAEKHIAMLDRMTRENEEILDKSRKVSEGFESKAEMMDHFRKVLNGDRKRIDEGKSREPIKVPPRE